MSCKRYVDMVVPSQQMAGSSLLRYAGRQENYLRLAG